MIQVPIRLPSCLFPCWLKFLWGLKFSMLGLVIASGSSPMKWGSGASLIRVRKKIVLNSFLFGIFFCWGTRKRTRRLQFMIVSKEEAICKIVRAALGKIMPDSFRPYFEMGPVRWSFYHHFTSKFLQLALGLPTSLLQSLSKAEVRTRAGPVVPGTLNPLEL